jgi:2'-5' RNA ligase
MTGSETTTARIFVGLKVAANIANDLAELAARLMRSRGRLVSPGDIHLTLVAPWQEASVEKAAETLKSAARGFSPFSLKFEHLGYGPSPGRPSLLWVDCAATHEVTSLRDTLMRTFGQTDARPFRPHITLARIPEANWGFARRHPIDIDLSFVQYVRTVELIKSPLPGAKGYQVLASAELEGAEREPWSACELG